jgi:hypothetical protein
MANYKTIYPGPLIEKFQFALKEEWGYIWGTAGVSWTAAKQAELEKNRVIHKSGSMREA